jgi:hypothetical protein
MASDFCGIVSEVGVVALMGWSFYFADYDRQVVDRHSWPC